MCTWHNIASTPSHTSSDPLAPLKKLYKRWYFWARCIRSWRESGDDDKGEPYDDDEEEDEEEEEEEGVFPNRCSSIFRIWLRRPDRIGAKGSNLLLLLLFLLLFLLSVLDDDDGGRSSLIAPLV